MDMPFVETLDEAKHFLRGPATYAHQSSPWKAPITSWMRPDAAAAVAAGHANGANGANGENGERLATEPSGGAHAQE